MGAGIALGLALEGFFGRNARLFIVCGVLSSDEDTQGFGRNARLFIVCGVLSSDEDAQGFGQSGKSSIL